MKDIELFQMALGLTPSWKVVSCEFNLEKKRLEIEIDFPRGSTFPCPKCGKDGCKAYDTEEKRWRHLNFFQCIYKGRGERFANKNEVKLLN